MISTLHELAELALEDEALHLFVQRWLELNMDLAAGALDPHLLEAELAALAVVVQQTRLTPDVQAELFNAAGRGLIGQLTVDPAARASEAEMRSLLRAWVARDAAAWSLAAEVMADQAEAGRR